MTIAALELASAGKSNPGRFVTPLIRRGWLYVIEQFAEPYKAGVRTLMLHRPNGESLEGSIMNLDARQDLMRDRDARKILDQQERFIEQFHRTYPDARLIVYLGSSQEPDWEQRIKANDLSALWDRYGRSLKPWFDCDFCDLCFDKAGSLDADNPHGSMLVAVDRLLAENMRTVYVEPQPKQWSVTCNMPCIMLERWWRKHADKSRKCGRWWSGHEEIATDSPWGSIIDWHADCVRRGDTPIVNVQQIGPILAAMTTEGGA